MAGAPDMQVEDTSDKAGGPASSGEFFSGSINGNLESYSLSGTAGGTIEASAGDPGYGMELGVDIFGPSGVLLQSGIATSSGDVVAVSATAPTTGTYYAVVKSINGGTGNYSFSMAGAPDTQVEDTNDKAGGPATSGESFSGSISGNLESYSISSAAGGTIDASAGDSGYGMEMGVDIFSPNGVLLQSAIATSRGDVVNVSAIAPTNGTYYVVLKSINGGTGNYNFSVHITASAPATNHAPQGAAKTVTTLEDTAYVFKTTDFVVTEPNDSPANTLLAVKISTLPAVGSLTDNGVAVAAGATIAVADITAGKLKLTPAANKNGANDASFKFQVRDNGGTANGGIDTDPTARVMTISVTSVNDALPEQQRP